MAFLVHYRFVVSPRYVLALLLGSATGLFVLAACGPPDYAGDDIDINLPNRRGGRGGPNNDDDGASSSSSTPKKGDAGGGGGGGGATNTDASPVALTDASIDAQVSAPQEQTFSLGQNDCGGGRCGGGYDDVKDTKQLTTASKQCVDRSFARAIDFTIGGQPGGRFCSFVPSTNTYGCDPSCSGCNIMTTVRCVKP